MSMEQPLNMPWLRSILKNLPGLYPLEKQSSSRAAFSILEALIAILILALVLIGAAPAFFYGTKLMHRASRRRIAVERASNEMESIVDRDFEQIQNRTRNITLGSTDESLAVATDATLSVSVQNRTWDGSEVDGKRVRVNVTWSVGGTTSDVDLSTLVSRVGAGR